MIKQGWKRRVICKDVRSWTSSELIVSVQVEDWIYPEPVQVLLLQFDT